MNQAEPTFSDALQNRRIENFVTSFLMTHHLPGTWQEESKQGKGKRDKVDKRTMEDVWIPVSKQTESPFDNWDLKKKLYFEGFFWLIRRLQPQGILNRPRPNLIKHLGAYLGASLSQVNRVRHLNKHLKFYKIGPRASQACLASDVHKCLHRPRGIARPLIWKNTK